MQRECLEETGVDHNFQHVVTFVCSGGTVFVYKAIAEGKYIDYKQMEDETLKVWELDGLPEKVDNDLNWLIPFHFVSIKIF